MNKIYLKIKWLKYLEEETYIGKLGMSYGDGWRHDEKAQNAYEKVLECKDLINECLEKWKLEDGDSFWVSEFKAYVYVCLKKKGTDTILREKVSVWVGE